MTFLARLKGCGTMLKGTWLAHILALKKEAWNLPLGTKSMSSSVTSAGERLKTYSFSCQRAL